jgi:hypothetical protein
MLTEENVKEQLSYAYLHAVAAKAELQCTPVDSVDNDSTDVQLRAANFSDDLVSTSPRFEVQLKATAAVNVADGEDYFPYDLKKKNYEDLRDTDRYMEAVLVVLIMPDEPERWLQAEQDRLITRYSAYWVDIKGAPQTNNTYSKTIHVPLTNHVTPSCLRRMMTIVGNLEDITNENPVDRGVIPNA